MVCYSVSITPEWLEKFGIKRLEVKGYVIMGAAYYRRGNITFYEVDGKYYIPIGERLGDAKGTSVIVFDKVHELQNIFALTGKEFKFKKA